MLLDLELRSRLLLHKCNALHYKSYRKFILIEMKTFVFLLRNMHTSNLHILSLNVYIVKIYCTSMLNILFDVNFISVQNAIISLLNSVYTRIYFKNRIILYINKNFKYVIYQCQKYTTHKLAGLWSVPSDSPKLPN